MFPDLAGVSASTAQMVPNPLAALIRPGYFASRDLKPFSRVCRTQQQHRLTILRLRTVCYATNVLELPLPPSWCFPAGCPCGWS